MKRPKRYSLTEFDQHLSAANPISGYVWEYTRPAAELHDVHFDLEAGIVLKGSVTRFVGSREVRLTAGDVWLCGIWEPHGVRIRALPCKVVVLSIWPQMLSNTHFEDALNVNWLRPFSMPTSRRPKITDDLRPAILDLGGRMASVIAGRGRYKSVHLRLQLLELLMLIYHDRPLPRVAEPVSRDIYATVNRAVNKVLASRHFINANEVAASLGLNRRIFSKQFLQVMGVSFQEFGLSHRLGGAAMDLLRTDRPIKMVATDWDFTDASHFHHCFIKRYGCSPHEYRRRPRAGGTC